MRKFMFLALLAIMPLQAFADHFWVCSQQTAQHDINLIENAGGIIVDVQCSVLNEMVALYTVKYRNPGFGKGNEALIVPSK